MLMLWAMKIQINNARGALSERSESLLKDSIVKDDGFSSFVGSEDTALTFEAELSKPLSKVKGKETHSLLIPG